MVYLRRFLSRIAEMRMNVALCDPDTTSFDLFSIIQILHTSLRLRIKSLLKRFSPTSEHVWKEELWLISYLHCLQFQRHIGALKTTPKKAKTKSAPPLPISAPLSPKKIKWTPRALIRAFTVHLYDVVDQSEALHDAMTKLQFS